MYIHNAFKYIVNHIKIKYNRINCFDGLFCELDKGKKTLFRSFRTTFPLLFFEGKIMIIFTLQKEYRRSCFKTRE